MSDNTTQINIRLEPEHAKRLAWLCSRRNMGPTALARSMIDKTYEKEMELVRTEIDAKEAYHVCRHNSQE